MYIHNMKDVSLAELFLKKLKLLCQRYRPSHQVILHHLLLPGVFN